MLLSIAQTTLSVLVFAAGLIIVLIAVLSTIRTFILPRSARDPISGFVFVSLRRLWEFRLRWLDTFEARDQVMALYAPVSLFLLLPVWLTLLTVGYAMMFWATGVQPWTTALRISGSSLLTLGYASDEQFFHTLLEFSEAALGLMLIALLIAYLPTMYTAFSKREVAVTQLDVRAGSPPTAAAFILRNHRIGNLDNLGGFWAMWETWFADVEESHTSLAALVFFRSPQPEYSWITAAGAVLDSAAFLAAAVDKPREPQAELCIRAGYLALQRIAEFFNVPYDANPTFPDSPISITRWEFGRSLARAGRRRRSAQSGPRAGVAGFLPAGASITTGRSSPSAPSSWPPTRPGPPIARWPIPPSPATCASSAATSSCGVSPSKMRRLSCR